MDANRADLVVLQVHSADDYATPWGDARLALYQVGGYPTTWMDGSLRRLGQHPPATYTADFEALHAPATDVTLVAEAELIGGATWRVSARVGVETGGAARFMGVHIVQALDHYPAGAHHRNCFMQAAPLQTVMLEPGQFQDIVVLLTFDAVSLARPEDIRIIAWAQDLGAAAPLPVHQAAMISYPFPPPCPADVNGDGAVSSQDFFDFLVDLFAATPGADFNADGAVNSQDFFDFLAAFFGGC
jgi:hypothetical protein